eukprot:TRINITY_DN2950_c0_g1_i16.p1 TRINITY_DN2950_c0_g1~~TRINITY_DN2950_c0_g1_i16.p1  ORF type:complete len:141 (+),score=10.50 TRINITY_DN2950_c0_g1_i16:112-534(+)
MFGSSDRTRAQKLFKSIAKGNDSWLHYICEMFRIGEQAGLTEEYVLENILNELKMQPDGISTYREFRGRKDVEKKDLIEWFIEMEMCTPTVNINKVNDRNPGKHLRKVEPVKCFECGEVGHIRSQCRHHLLQLQWLWPHS